MLEQVVSLGRVVHYQPKETETPNWTCAAIVIHTEDAPAGTPIEQAPHGLRPTLLVFKSGEPWTRYIVPFSPTPKPGHWSWPPHVPAAERVSAPPPPSSPSPSEPDTPLY